MTHYQHVVEIGAGDSHSSEALHMDAERITLYEPHPVLCADLSRAAAGLPHVSVCNEAVTSHFDDLFCLGYASFLRGNPSFLATSVEPEGMTWWEPLAREVACQKVDRVDFGTIDYLILTNNGGEMDVLRGLVSRPKVIITKHYLHNAAQCATANDVSAWLMRHGYVTQTLASNQHGTFYHLKHTLNA